MYQTSPGVDVSKAPYKANKGCPCTPQQICTLPEFADVFHGGCEIPRHPQRTYSMHGGSGALISVGLLRRVGLQTVEDCIKGDISTGAYCVCRLSRMMVWHFQCHACATHTHPTGGDAFITICLWKAGYGMTDPGWSFFHPEFRMFDAGPEDRQGVLMRLSKALDRRCDDMCQVRSHAQRCPINNDMVPIPLFAPHR